MADYWIPIRIHASHPKILRIAELTGDDPVAVVGRMVEWFRYIDENCETRNTIVGREGFHRIIRWQTSRQLQSTFETTSEHLCDYFEALLRPEIGWIIVKDGLIVVPEYERFFAKSAKRRILDTRRKGASRCGQNADTLRTHCGTTAGHFAPETETETETVSDSISEETGPDSDSVSGATLKAVHATTRLRIVELMKVPVDRYQDKTAIGKQVRSDLTTIERLLWHAVTEPGEDGRRQASRVVALAREAVATCGRHRPMAKLVHLAKGAGLYPEKAGAT